MKRLAIFSFFDIDGIVDKYVEYLLEKLLSVISDLIIVVNGKITCSDYYKLEQFTSQILVRENIGYDAGAYKEVLVNYLSDDEFDKYDEIILLNNTIFGPFVSFEEIWHKMKKKKVDFWGINLIDVGLFSHIQSYFLVFEKQIVETRTLKKFFEEHIDENEEQIDEIYVTFECGLFHYLTEHNYAYGVYSPNSNLEIYRNSYFMVSQYNFPIMKKKGFSPELFEKENIAATLNWIDMNTNYDINLILDCAKRIYGFSYSQKYIKDYKADISRIVKYISYKRISEEELNSFLECHKDVYIYGTGAISKRIYYLYIKNKFTVKGFIVSDGQPIIQDTMYDIKIYRLSKIIDNEAPIIVALGKENVEQVKSLLPNRKNVLYLEK